MNNSIEFARLWRNPAMIVTLICAPVMLSGVALMSNTALQTAIVKPPSILMFAPIAGALIASGAAVWYLINPSDDARNLIVIGGLLALLYFAGFIRMQDSLDVLNDLPLAFWLVLIGTVGLFVQYAIPRFENKGSPQKKVQRINTDVLAGRSVQSLSWIILRQNIGVSFSALAANKLRSALTMLGIVIGVMTVVALLAVGQGAQDSVTEQIQNIGTNLLTISPIRGGSATPLVESDAEAIEAQVSGLEAVIPEYQQNGATIRNDETTINATVLGTGSQFVTVRNVTIASGRFFDDIDYEDNAKVAVLGSTVTEDLFGLNDPIGQTIYVNNQRFEVIGILAQQDSGIGFDPNDQVFIPLTSLYRFISSANAPASNEKQVTSITMMVTKSDDIDTVMAVTEQVLRATHELDTDEDNNFRVFNQQQLLDTATSVTETFTVLLGAVAAISLVVGGIGIMNISLVSVTERTKEIGLRKALGARRIHILQQFLIETVVLSTLGGIIGVLSGISIAYVANSSGTMAATITPESIVLGLGFSIIIGIFFGVYPATRAAALQPIEALRYE